MHRIAVEFNANRELAQKVRKKLSGQSTNRIPPVGPQTKGASDERQKHFVSL
jgi:hypothetical protein